jgi:hypothetical protein
LNQHGVRLAPRKRHDQRTNVSLWHETDIVSSAIDVRCRGKNGHRFSSLCFAEAIDAPELTEECAISRKFRCEPRSNARIWNLRWTEPRNVNRTVQLQPKKAASCSENLPAGSSDVLRRRLSKPIQQAAAIGLPISQFTPILPAGDRAREDDRNGAAEGDPRYPVGVPKNAVDHGRRRWRRRGQCLSSWAFDGENKIAAIKAQTMIINWCMD